jgi:hypothetical protein
MLDVHPPHHAATTWRDFFIHIITIVIGLLIAISLEQTVEYFHHRHQVAEAREALRIEREININRFAIATAEFRRFAPILQSDLNVLVYVHDHPGAKFTQLPARFNWYTITIPFNDSAWKTAQQSGVLQYMPRAEVQRYSQLYDRLTRLAFRLQSERDALFRARGFTVRDADPTHLSPAELAHQLDLMTDVVLMHGTSGGEQRNINRLYPDFAPAPSTDELYQVLHSPPAPDDVKAVAALSEKIAKFDAEHGEDTQDSQDSPSPEGK